MAQGMIANDSHFAQWCPDITVHQQYEPCGENVKGCIHSPRPGDSQEVSSSNGCIMLKFESNWEIRIARQSIITVLHRS